MKTIRPLILLTLVAFCSSVAVGAEHTKDSLDQVKKSLKEKKAVLIDVREQNEWDAGHLQDATLLPLSQIRRGIDPKDLDKDKIIYCHCRSGGRVLAATDILKKQGYDIRPLKLGYADLIKEGFPKATKKPRD